MKVRFKGHETFYFREGWLTKALIYMDTNNQTLFNEADVIQTLGVGSNMVKSIKYWMTVCGLYKTPSRNSNDNGLTQLGRIIARHDVYFEKPYTLWLLHINLISNINAATTWSIFFNYFDIDTFTLKDVQVFLKNEVEKLECQYNEKSLNNDISLLLNMYDTEDEGSDPEDNLICPFSHLGLIQKVNSSYVRKQIHSRDIPDLLSLYIIVKYASENHLVNIPIQSITSGSMSFKSIFNCSRVTINELLERLESLGYIRIVKASGLESIQVIRAYEDVNMIVQQYFEEEN